MRLLRSKSRAHFSDGSVLIGNTVNVATARHQSRALGVDLRRSPGRGGSVRAGEPDGGRGVAAQINLTWAASTTTSASRGTRSIAAARRSRRRPDLVFEHRSGGVNDLHVTVAASTPRTTCRRSPSSASATTPALSDPQARPPTGLAPRRFRRVRSTSRGAPRPTTSASRATASPAGHTDRDEHADLVLRHGGSPLDGPQYTVSASTRLGTPPANRTRPRPRPRPRHSRREAPCLSKRAAWSRSPGPKSSYNNTSLASSTKIDASAAHVPGRHGRQRAGLHRRRFPSSAGAAARSSAVAAHHGVDTMHDVYGFLLKGSNSRRCRSRSSWSSIMATASASMRSTDATGAVRGVRVKYSRDDCLETIS